MPYSQVLSIIEHELGNSIAHLFHHFEKEPLASASISQVHRATLRTGEKVVVKVQRPDVGKLMETDTEIMLYFARLIENYHEGLKKYNPVKIVAEFQEWAGRELDFKLEARNAKRFYENFKNSKTVRIPKVYDELTSGKIITMEYIEGIQLHNIKEIKRKKLDFSKVMENGFSAIMQQVFEHGIFHADPHPGNILVLPDNAIAFVDFGIVGFFDEKLKNRCIDLLYGIACQDEDLIVNTFVELGMHDQEIDHSQFKSDISYVIQPLQDSSINEIKVSRVLEEVLSVALKHGLKVPAPFVLFGKTIITLEGIALEYDPNFKIMESIRPLAENLVRKRTSPLYLWKSMMHNMDRYKRFAESFPEKANRALEKIEKGTVRVDIEDTDIKKLSLELNKSSNRIAYGLMVAAFLITSTLLVNMDKGPSVLGDPFLAFCSVFFASILILILIISIMAEKFHLRR